MELNDIKRIYQGKKKEDNDLPLVYIKFHLQKTTPSIIKEIIHGNKNKKLTISAQQMYSKATQQKMDTANKIKKSFKDCPKKKE